MLFKVLTVLVVVVLCTLYGVEVATVDDKYTTRFDSIDLDEILGNDRLMTNYINCLLDKGKCTAEGRALKDVLSDAIETDCVKCSETQKKGAKKVIKNLVKRRKEKTWWDDLQKKYDPELTYRNKYRAEFAKEDIYFDDDAEATTTAT